MRSASILRETGKELKSTAPGAKRSSARVGSSPVFLWENTLCSAAFAEKTSGLIKNGFSSADAWTRNLLCNRKFQGESMRDRRDGVEFIEAKEKSVCLCEAQEFCIRCSLVWRYRT